MVRRPRDREIASQFNELLLPFAVLRPFSVSGSSFLVAPQSRACGQRRISISAFQLFDYHSSDQIARTPQRLNTQLSTYPFPPRHWSFVNVPHRLTSHSSQFTGFPASAPAPSALSIRKHFGYLRASSHAERFANRRASPLARAF